jgi:hypothetical protein
MALGGGAGFSIGSFLAIMHLANTKNVHSAFFAVGSRVEAAIGIEGRQPRSAAFAFAPTKEP